MKIGVRKQGFEYSRQACARTGAFCLERHVNDLISATGRKISISVRFEGSLRVVNMKQVHLMVFENLSSRILTCNGMILVGGLLLLFF